jgi:uncharacterized protein YndB with AHSA1/START domain
MPEHPVSDPAEALPKPGNAPHGNLVIAWRFPAPPARVWHAWTEPGMMKRWFGSDPQGHVVRASADPRVGGAFEVTFVNSDGSGYTCFGRYLEVEQDTKLVFSWSWRDSPGPGELLTLRFEPRDGGTLMRFEHANIDPDTTHNYALGWKSTFEKLERALG